MIPAARPDGKPAKAVSLAQEEYERLVEQAKEASKYQDQYLRALAELDNAKKRLDREREEFIRLSSARLVSQMLPILDSFQQALKVIDASHDPEPTVAGVRLIFRQLMELLEKEGVKRIDALGKPFDASVHEAVQQVETNGYPEHTVVEEVQAGYTLHETVIRPALVKVAKKPAEKQQIEV
jgi:molecular chaperone GrpE